MHESPAHRNREIYSPIFVLCHAHAYSSICTAVLGSHPDLYWFPELRLFNAHTLGQALETMGGPGDLLRNALDPGGDLDDAPVSEGSNLRLSGIVRAVAELYFGSQSEDDIERAWAWVRHNKEESTAELFDHLLDKVAPKTGIEKSPDTAASDAHLMLCRESFPRARFVHLIRHPLTAAESLRDKLAIAYESANLGERSPIELYRRALRIWFSVNQRIDRFAGRLDEGQVFRLRAEELLNDPATNARRFCTWAEISDDGDAVGAMLHPERSPFAQPGPAHAPGGEHGEFLHDPTLRTVPDAGPVTIPAEWGLNRNEERGIVELASDLGYK